MSKRKHFSAIQKAQIALEILKEEKTVSQIASENEVHPNVLYRWKTSPNSLRTKTRASKTDWPNTNGKSTDYTARSAV
jgi:transposase-like protein